MWLVENFLIMYVAPALFFSDSAGVNKHVYNFFLIKNKSLLLVYLFLHI